MNICCFFDNSYQTPSWLTQKLSRRHILKSAAGIATIASMPSIALGGSTQPSPDVIKTEPWLTLDAVLNHLLPTSDSGPGAKEIRATQYLYNLIYQQPTPTDEVEFIYQGVGWLNDYSKEQTQQRFSVLTAEKKEQVLQAIAQSRAGENWLSILMNNILEAMLTAPSYGGNPNGIGWQWLQHQAGFPLPNAGQRYYELPKRGRARIKEAKPIDHRTDSYATNAVTKVNKGTKKA